MKILRLSLILFLLNSLSHVYGQEFTVSGGGRFSVSVSANGELYSWGDDTDGQLGNGPLGSTSTPTVINTFPSGVLILQADGGSGSHAMALDCDGYVWAWGSNCDGQVGNGAGGRSLTQVQNGSCSAADVTEPAQVLNGEQTAADGHDGSGYLSDVRYITGGNVASYAIVGPDRALMSWGSNVGTKYPTSGQVSILAGLLGNNDITVDYANEPVYVRTSNDAILRDVLQVDAMDAATIALTSDGSVYSFGYDGDNKSLGQGGAVPGDRSIAANRVRKMAYNNGTYTPDGFLENIVQITAGDQHALAIDANGNVWTWGGAWAGQTGARAANGGAQNGAVLLQAGESKAVNPGADTSALQNATFVSATQIGSAVVVTVDKGGKPHGYLYTFGGVGTYPLGGETYAHNTHGGQLGLNQTTSIGADNPATFTPSLVETFNDGGTLIDADDVNVVAVSDGDGVFYVITQDPTTKQREIWVMGSNVEGQLGIGGTTSRYIPTKLTGISNIAEPCPEADLGADFEVCYGFTETLYAGSEASTYEYTWTWIDEDGNETDVTPATDAARLDVTEAGQYIVEIIRASAGGCSSCPEAIDTVEISYSAPDFSEPTDSLFYCSDFTIDSYVETTNSTAIYGWFASEADTDTLAKTVGDGTEDIDISTVTKEADGSARLWVGDVTVYQGEVFKQAESCDPDFDGNNSVFLNDNQALNPNYQTRFEAFAPLTLTSVDINVLFNIYTAGGTVSGDINLAIYGGKLDNNDEYIADQTKLLGTITQTISQTRTGAAESSQIFTIPIDLDIAGDPNGAPFFISTAGVPLTNKVGNGDIKLGLADCQQNVSGIVDDLTGTYLHMTGMTQNFQNNQTGTNLKGGHFFNLNFEKGSDYVCGRIPVDIYEKCPPCSPPNVPTVSYNSSTFSNTDSIKVCSSEDIQLDFDGDWTAADPLSVDKEFVMYLVNPSGTETILGRVADGSSVTSISGDTLLSATDTPEEGWYVYGVRNTVTCVEEDSVYLKIDALPSPSILISGSDTSYCSGNSGVILEGEDGVSSDVSTLEWYTWNGTDTIAGAVTTGSPSLTALTGTSTGTDYVLVATNGECKAISSPVTVTENTTPSLTVTDPSGVCSPLTVDLSTVWSDVNTSGGTAAYEYSSDGTVFTSITNTAAAVVADSGLYRVIVTNGTCADTANINVEIYSLPVLSLGFSPNDTVCVGTEVTLSDLNYTTGNSYVWSMSGSGTTEEEKVTPSTDLLFNVEVTDGNGCVSTADSVVRVDAAPDLVAPQGDMEVCATTATLPQVTPSVGTGVWSKLSTSTSGTIVDVTDPSTQVTGISPGTFIDAKWTVSNGVCPDVTDTVRVSSLTAINPVVNVNTPLSFNVCEDSDTTIIATGSSAGTYEYYVTGTPSSVLGTDSILDVTNITTVQQITVSFTATECVASGATNPVTKDIVITPMTAPTATITGFADGATYIFNELPGTVTGTAPGTGYDYSWEANPSTKGSANLLDYGFNSTMAYDDVVNLDFIVRNSGGECPSDTAHLEVIRKDITTAEALNDTICVTGGNNYTQTPQNLPNTSNNEQAEWLALVGSPTPSAGTGLDVTLTSKGEYGYVYRIYNPTVLDANSKPIESRDTVMIVVDAEVVGPVSAGVATDVCTDTVSLSGTGLSTGESGFWTGPSGLIFTEATSPTSQVTNFTDGVSHTLTWTKYSEYGVCPSVSGTVNLNKLSSVTAAAITGEDTLDVCLGDPVVLYSNAALASNNETGIWSSTDISLPSTSLNSTTLDITSEITSSAEGNYKLKWTISSTSCPTGSVDSVIVAVSGKPSQPSITGLPTMCEDSTATYTISSDPKATLGYVWSVKGQGSVVGTDTSGVVKFDRQLALTDAQKETVWVYAQSMNVCGGSEKDSMEVIIDLAPRQADYVAPSTSLSLQSDLTSICETTSGEVLEVTTPTGNNATKYRWMVEGTRLGNETTVPLSNQFDASDIPGFSDGSVVNMEVLFGNACGYYGAISDIAVTLVSKNDLEIDLSLANEIALDSVTSRELYAICSLDDSYSIKVEGQGVDLTGTDIVYDLIIDGELVLSDFPSNQLDGSLLLPSAKLPDGIVEVTAEISDPTKGCFTSPAIDSDQISLRDYSFEKFDIVGNKLICESDADLSLSLSIPQDTKDKKHNKIERAIWRFEDGSEMYGTTIEIGDPSKAGEVSLELINVNGCQTFNSEPEINPIEVVIDEKPVIVIEGKPVITVPVDVNNELPEYQLSSYVTNLNASEYTSNWGAESITSKLTESEILSWLSSTSVINPVIDPLDEDVARLIVTVVNGACETKDSIDIRATKPFMPPTAFTPNGDGLNDSWVVEGLTAYNKAVMKIYNRWGQLVFEKYGGYYDQFDGKNLPMATYYWTVEFNEPDKAPESGTVTILK